MIDLGCYPLRNHIYICVSRPLSAEGPFPSTAKPSGFGDTSSSSRPLPKPQQADPLTFSRSEDELPGLGGATAAAVAPAAMRSSSGGGDTSAAGGRAGRRGGGLDVRECSNHFSVATFMTLISFVHSLSHQHRHWLLSHGCTIQKHREGFE